MNKININTNIDTTDLISEIVDNLNYDDVVEFIKNLDLAMESWDHTLDLYKHFKMLKKEFDNESSA